MSEAVRQVLPADAVAPSIVRRRVRRWLIELGWPEVDADDLLLAVSEAVSNAADHAYPPGRTGEVVVDAECVPDSNGSRQVVITVVDHGSWRPPPAWHENRRRGVPLMRACTESVDIRGSASGTSVRMVSKPVAALV
ncbi:MAG TPA: ATP-binding protein [Pseudonocardia sp.]|jgi:anti-sigma regulatory factor (Ser/Thr protein kinase)|uniref:ATP-binding protein n=1 Tax=Pseudonocardia sp. TaxID=60912 RepID=UPI002EDAEC60